MTKTHHNDEELTRLERMLDSHGAEERRTAPTGMSERIAQAASRAAREDDAPGVLARIGFGVMQPLRLAAAIVLLVGGAIVALLVINSGQPGQLTVPETTIAAEEFDLWMAALASDPLETLPDASETEASLDGDFIEGGDDLYASFWSGTEASDSFLEDVL